MNTFVNFTLKTVFLKKKKQTQNETSDVSGKGHLLKELKQSVVKGFEIF